MGRRQTARAASTTAAAALAAAATVHAPKKITAVPADPPDARARSAPDPKRASARPLTPWPSPFTQLAEDVTSPSPSARARSAERPTNDPNSVVRRRLPTDPAPATADHTVLPLDPAPDPFTLPVSPARVLPTPVTSDPLSPPGLTLPPGVFVPSPIASTFGPVIDGTDPFAFAPPTFDAPILAAPAVGLVSVPEPAAVSVLIAAPVLLGRRRK